VWRLILAQAAEGAAESGADGVVQRSPLGSMLPMFIAFIAIMYFLMIRPQQKREKERRELLSSVSKGDSVITNGGICGTVVGLTESHVVLRVDEDVTIQFVRSAVAQITARAGESQDKK
jgi:preprotein translocase subunit YajC